MEQEPIQASDVLLYAGQKYGVFEVDGKIEVMRLSKRHIFAVHPYTKKQVLENGKSLMPNPSTE